MHYIKVIWHHDIPTEPIVIFSELDHDRWEKRKVEEYSDGRLDAASQGLEMGTTGLSIEPLPSNEQIKSDPQFTLEEISQQEFEKVW